MVLFFTHYPRNECKQKWRDKWTVDIDANWTSHFHGDNAKI